MQSNLHGPNQELIAATPEEIENHITVLKYPHENENKLKAYILLAYELFWTYNLSE